MKKSYLKKNKKIKTWLKKYENSKVEIWLLVKWWIWKVDEKIWIWKYEFL